MINKKRSQTYRSKKESVSKEKKTTYNNKKETETDQSDERFAVVFNSSPIAMSLTSIPDSRIIDVNPAWLDLVGITTKEEVLGKTILELGLIPDEKLRNKILNEFKQNGFVNNAEIIVTTKNSDRISLLVNIKEVEIAGTKYMFFTDENITELKLAQEKILQSKTTFTELVERAPFGIYIIDSGFHIAQMNLRSQNGAFKNVRPLIGRDFSEAMHILWPDDVAEGIISSFRHTLDTGEPFYSPPFVNPRNDIRIVEAYEWELQRIMLHDGKYGVICYYFDSSALREAERVALENEAALRRSEEQYRILFETMSEGFALNELIFDASGKPCDLRYLMVNPAFELHTGIKGADIIGKTRLELFPDEEMVWLDRYAKVVMTGEPSHFEEWFMSLNRCYNVNVSKVSESRFTVVFTDITERKLIEQKLRKSENLLRSTLDNMLEGCQIIDSEFKYIYMNAETERQLGRPKEELLGNIYYEMFPAIVENQIFSYINDCLINRTKKTFLNEFLYPDGRLGCYKINLEPVPEGVLILSEDISERIQAEEALQRSAAMLKAIGTNTPDSIFVKDIEGRMLYVNPSVLQLVNLRESQVLGHLDTEWHPNIEEAKKLMANDRKVMNSGQTQVIEEVYTDEKGVHTFLSTKSPLLDSNGKVIGLIGLSRDISERKKAEIKLIESEAQLLELNKTKDKFFNIVAHDLKNPFTSILGSSELLFENINQMSPKNIRKLALILNESAKSGYLLLLNLLDWSRSQTGMLKISSEKINLKDIVDANIKSLQLTSQIKGITIINEAEDNLRVISDRNIINTILRNLLSNAIKFTRRDGKVVVRFIPNHDTVTILVTDNGIGIPQEKIGTLFKLENVTPLPGTENEIGTGLGLMLSKELIEKLGGIISVESEYGKGSTFFCTIPRNNLR